MRSRYVSISIHTLMSTVIRDMIRPLWTARFPQLQSTPEDARKMRRKLRELRTLWNATVDLEPGVKWT